GAGALTAAGAVVGLVTALQPGALTLAVAGGLSYAVLCLASPGAGLMAAVLIGPPLTGVSYFLAEGIPDVTFPRFAVVCLGAGYGLRRWRGWDPPPAVSRYGPAFWMAVFAGVALVTTFLRYTREAFLETVLFFMDSCGIPFLYYALAARLLGTARAVRRLAFWAIPVALVLAGMGFYEFMTGTDLFQTEIRREIDMDAALEAGFTRSTGPFAETSTYGIVLGVLFFLILYDFRRIPAPGRRRARAWLEWGAAAVSGAGVCLSLMRMTILALVGGIASRVLFVRRVWPRYLTLALIILFVTAGGWEALRATRIYRNRIADLETGTVRLATWKAAVSLLPRYVWLGAGFHGSRAAQEAIPVRIEYRGAEPRPTTHNSLLMLLIETGVWGLAAFSLIIASVIRMLVRFARGAGAAEEREFAAAMAGMVFLYVLPALTLASVKNAAINTVFFASMGVLAGRYRRRISERRSA
ncbi:MAG: O-antigen ligase family protein, partial [Lentisphaerae bacterium]|nr:O-antigen ligase family protein [Lentisphaerota bacterium]